MSQNPFNLSSFPDQIDQWSDLFDLPPQMVNQARRMQELRAQPTLSAAEQTELNNLVETLSDFLITPERFNHFSHALSNTQRFFRDETSVYVDRLQENMHALFQSRVGQMRLIGMHDPQRAYQMHNMVHDPTTGDLFIALQDIPAGNQLNQTDRWTRLSERGHTGLAITFRGRWMPANTYSLGDGVKHDDILFYALQDVPANTPPSNENRDYWAAWERIVSRPEEPMPAQAGMIWIEELD